MYRWSLKSAGFTEPRQAKSARKPCIRTSAVTAEQRTKVSSGSLSHEAIAPSMSLQANLSPRRGLRASPAVPCDSGKV